MRSFLSALTAVTVTGLLLCIGITGCDNASPKNPIVVPFQKPKPEEKRTALDAPGRGGIVRGKVLFDGDPPVMKPIDKIRLHNDRDVCLMAPPAELRQQTWFVDNETKAVANIVVWVEPPAGKFFTLTDEEKNRPGELVRIDQPHCAYVPHVVTLFPAYFDGAKEVKTGQELELVNSAKVRHAVIWNETFENAAYMFNIAPLPENNRRQVFLNPQKTPLKIGCGDHGWMVAVAWIFDHPFHTVSKADGSFEIKNLPTDVELTFKAWHESRQEAFEVRKMTFKKGENPPLELKIAAPVPKEFKK